jgi:hypothetical protein
MMEAEGLGARIVTSITRQVMEYLGFAFVDDTENISQGDAPIEAVLTMQALLNAWADGSRVMGGQLVPEKSHWFLADPVSLPDGSFRYCRIPHKKYKLFLKTAMGQVQELQRLPLEHAPHTLGIYATPTGNMTYQFQALKTKSDEWAKRIQISSLP